MRPDICQRQTRKSDILDSLDIQLLHALQRDGRAPFNRIARDLGVSDQTVLRRLRRLRATAGVRVVGVADEALLGRESWMIRLQCLPNVAEDLAVALAKRPDTAYVSITSGGTEVTCGIMPHSEHERDELLLKRLARTPRIVSVSSHCLLHFYFGGPLGWLTKNDPARAPVTSPSPVWQLTVDEPEHIDDVDEKLITALSYDGRLPIRDLQEAVGQSESAERRRLERLQARGVLYFDVQFNPALLGRTTKAMFWFTVAPSELRAVGRALAEHPEVSFAAAVTGQANLIAYGLFRSVGELYQYLNDRVGALSGVDSVETVLIVRQLKQLANAMPG
jgi:DNA-binding Lrp family transcriptional regulator